MLQFFNQYIGGENVKLGVMLGVGSSVTVKQISNREPITVTVKTEDGEIDHCTHAGSRPQEFFTEEYSYNNEDIYQKYFIAEQCDKCEAVYNDLMEEWEK